MEIHISKESEVPLRRQLAEQIVYLIATEELRPGQALPSVRELARRLKIHHNTVSEAYQDLVRRTWLVRRRGTRVMVRTLEEALPQGRAGSLDELINTVIRTAREQGYSLQTLRDRVRQRMLDAPPDHILAVEEDETLGRLLREEIETAIDWPVEVCSRAQLTANPGLAIGALAVAAHYAIADVDPLLPGDRPAISLTFSAATEHIEMIRKRREPSVIALVSVSPGFMHTARSLLAPTLGRRHVLQEVLLPLSDPQALSAADVVIADSIAARAIKRRAVMVYRLIAPVSLDYLADAVKTYSPP